LFEGVGFSLAAGGLLYVRGANGTGKTSLLRILCGLSPAEDGRILWDGSATRELGALFRRALIYLGHGNALQESLNARENLAYVAALAGVAATPLDLNGALARVGLRGAMSQPVRHLSQGQKRRVALARLLLAPARLWVLDEPFVALDTHGVNLLAGLINDHLAAGGLAILTSHQQVELCAVSEHVVELGT